MSRVQCRFRLWNEKRFRLGLLDGHTCSDSACSDSGSAVGSGFRSLMVVALAVGLVQKCGGVGKD